MPVTTTSAALHITPGARSSILIRLLAQLLTACVIVAIKTFIKHAKRKGVKLKDGDATVEGLDDILYDE